MPKKHIKLNKLPDFYPFLMDNISLGKTNNILVGKN